MFQDFENFSKKFFETEKGAESFRCRRRALGMIGVQKYVECREHRLKNTHKN